MIYFKSLLNSFIFRLTISLLIIAFLSIKLPVYDIWYTMNQISLLFFGVCIVILLIGHAISSLRWSLLINIEKSHLPFSVAFRYYFAGLFANIFLPSIAGGDVIRAGMAIRYCNEKETVVLCSLLDRFLDTSALALISLIGSLFVPIALATEDRGLLVLVFLTLLGLALCGLFFFLGPLSRIVPQRLDKVISRGRDLIMYAIKNPQRALVGLVLALIVHAGFIVLGAVVGAACGIRLPLPVWFFIWPLAKLMALLPISMGGLGVREVALAALLGRFGIAFSSSVGLGLLWETFFIAVGMIGGITYFFLNRMSQSSEVLATVGASQRCRL